MWKTKILKGSCILQSTTIWNCLAEYNLYDYSDKKRKRKNRVNLALIGKKLGGNKNSASISNKNLTLDRLNSQISKIKWKLL